MKLNELVPVEYAETGLPIWTPDEDIGKDIDASVSWLESSLDEILNDVHTHGCVLLRGLECCTDAGEFDQLIRVILPELRDYVGGASPRTTIHKKIMAATQTPDDWSIIPHQEMSYTKNPPAYISFFCQKPALHGEGASTLTDMRAALAAIDPDVVERFRKHGVQLCRTLPSAERMHLKPGVKKSWQEAFDTTSKTDVERGCAERGWSFEWHGDDLLLWQGVVDAIRTHRITGEETWCNHAHFLHPPCMIAWADADGRTEDAKELRQAYEKTPELLERMFLGNGEPVADADALHILEVLWNMQKPVFLKKSDILVLDNLTMAHGRMPFNGERSLMVALDQRNIAA